MNTSTKDKKSTGKDDLSSQVEEEEEEKVVDDDNNINPSATDAKPPSAGAVALVVDPSSSLSQKGDTNDYSDNEEMTTIKNVILNLTSKQSTCSSGELEHYYAGAETSATSSCTTNNLKTIIHDDDNNNTAAVTTTTRDDSSSDDLFSHKHPRYAEIATATATPAINPEYNEPCYDHQTAAVAISNFNNPNINATSTNTTRHDDTCLSKPGAFPVHGPDYANRDLERVVSVSSHQPSSLVVEERTTRASRSNICATPLTASLAPTRAEQVQTIHNNSNDTKWVQRCCCWCCAAVFVIALVVLVVLLVVLRDKNDEATVLPTPTPTAEPVASWLGPMCYLGDNYDMDCPVSALSVDESMPLDTHDMTISAWFRNVNDTLWFSFEKKGTRSGAATLQLYTPFTRGSAAKYLKSTVYRQEISFFDNADNTNTDNNNNNNTDVTKTMTLVDSFRHQDRAPNELDSMDRFDLGVLTNNTYFLQLQVVVPPPRWVTVRPKIMYLPNDQDGTSSGEYEWSLVCGENCPHICEIPLGYECYHVSCMCHCHDGKVQDFLAARSCHDTITPPAGSVPVTTSLWVVLLWSFVVALC